MGRKIISLYLLIFLTIFVLYISIKLDKLVYPPAKLNIVDN